MYKIKSAQNSEESLGKIKRAWYSSADETISRKNSISTDVKNSKEMKKEKRIFNPLYLFNRYIKSGSIHGLRYIFDSELYIIERFVWFIFVIISIVLTAKAICTVSADFHAAPTITVIESTNFKVSSLPFPSVTICPRDRVDWKKVLKLEEKLIPSNDSKYVQIFRKLMTSLSSMSFARFDEMTFLNNFSLNGLQDINVTNVLLNVAPSCEDIFSSCRWRYDNKDCCKIFALQKTEHGFCYSFNSVTSENSNLTSENLLRTSGYGDRSGLKVTLHLGNLNPPPSHSLKGLSTASTMEAKRKCADLIRGATLFVAHPNVWPSSGQAIAAGMALTVNVQCTSGYATKNVLNLSPKKIPCKYSEGMSYSQETCISNCRRDYVKKHCDCNPSYFFPHGGARDCNIKDFICLIEHNAIFTNYQIPGDNRRIQPNEPIMFCDCPPACDFYDYETQIVALPLMEENLIMLDVHFENPTSTRYRMEVVLNFQNLLVAFGGIFGLFVGGSILSLIELLYTCFVALFGGSYLYLTTRNNEKTNKEYARKNSKIYTINFPPLRSKMTSQSAMI